MAPRTNKIRIAQLDPADVGEAAHNRVVGQAASLAMATGYSLAETAGGAALSDVRQALTALTRYAQTGQPPEGRSELVPEYLISVAPLYTRACDAGYEVPDLDEDADPATPWGLALVGAVARHLLAQGEPVRALHLGVLAGVDPAHVHLLARRGEIERAEDGSYSAEVARRWLSGRGVEGV